jgi:ATP-dependent DNA helicase RecQ
MALSCVYRARQASGFNFGAGHLIDILCGNRSDKVLQRGHERLSTFGIGAALSETEWRAVFRQLVALGYLAVDHAGFGALTLTEASRLVLRGEQTVTLRRYVKPAKPVRGARNATGHTSERADPAAGMDEHERACWERLRAWRTEIARHDDVPAYVIFHDATLAEIARSAPTTLDGLRYIPGIGARKLERFGEDLLSIVAQE